MEASPSPATGQKRKRGSEPKFYAVHRGAKPGIYHDWNDCRAQITGFKGAIFKSFPTQQEAEAFVANGMDARTSTKGPQKYYGIQSGKVPGVYTSWEEASAQITGQVKPRYKAFQTKAEAEEFVKAAGNRSSNGDGAAQEDSAARDAAKKKKKGRESAASGPEDDSGYGPGEGPIPSDAEDFFDPSVKLDSKSGKVEYKTDEQLRATKSQAKGLSDDGMLRIWTDGSSRGNGTANAIAGVGVYFGPGDKRNVAEPLAGPRQTNQRAELTAILRALELSPRDRPVTILSDSEYAINCVTTWFQKWRANGWLNASKKPVENKDLIEKILQYIEEREKISNMYGISDGGDEAHETAKTRSWKKGRARVHFVWVKGHANEPGNVAADALAVAGATGRGSSGDEA
ncbi:ribonuclease-like protein 2 [Elsinoe australis]|uniref:ribonuclease H n=1 Tax=Elsinoe australis TaxID=40998 RepID=A0A4U7ASA3_9PEZI|nr:ribonuclease-like protein 2 [Elsinoe australis]